MDKILITADENVVQTHRELGPFEHLLWLVDQWTPRHFIFVSRIEGSSISVRNPNAALLQSQRRHPILRTAIHVNDVTTRINSDTASPFINTTRTSG